jgi:monoamine oxidase
MSSLPMLSRRRALLTGGAAAGSTLLDIPRLRAAPDRTDVIVVGAGLSGLNAALLIKGQGFSVKVLEGRKRAGGRVNSLRSVEGNPELGGDSILGGYGRMQDMAQRLKVTLVNHEGRRDLSPEAMKDPTTVELALGGHVIPKADWATHPLNAMPAGAKDRFPGRGFYQKLIDDNNPLKSFEDWTKPESGKFDRSAYEFFKSLGWDDAAINLNYNTNIQYGTSAHDISILMWFFTEAWFKLQSDIKRVAYKAEGGNQSIPEAMAHEVGSVSFDKQVIGIRSNDKDCEVQCADGSIHRASRVICSLPVPTMRWVKFDPGLSPAKAKAIATVPVQKISKVILIPKSPFWREDGLSPAMWTDTDAGEVRALREGKDPNTITCLMAWARGFLADRLDTMGEEAAKAHVIAEYEKLRPAAKGKLVAAAYKSWQVDPFAGGDWVVWQPGQIGECLKPLMEPAGRIHFCGEHTATANRGMEGAMESGERAALEAMAVL